MSSCVRSIVSLGEFSLRRQKGLPRRFSLGQRIEPRLDRIASPDHVLDVSDATVSRDQIIEHGLDFISGQARRLVFVVLRRRVLVRVVSPMGHG